MSTILSGTWRVVLTAAHGVRLEPVELHLRAHVRAQMRPLWSRAIAFPPLPGREAVVAAARREILAPRPVEFHAPCGYGKTTLLRYLASGAVWAPSVYVRVGSAPLDDVLQMVVDRLYSCPEPVKATRAECEAIIRGCRALVVLDDVPPSSGIPNEAAAALPGCGLVIGSTRPVLTGLGGSRMLHGLSPDAALDLYARSLGRGIGADDITDVRRLLAALDGRPLHVKQAAALVRAGEFTASRLAEEAATAGPEALNQLSLRRLDGVKRRALTVLTLFAGALLPAALVSGVGDIAFVLQYLDELHRDGLAEHPDDRFGIPVCRKESYQQQLLGQIDYAGAVRGLADWLADPSGPHALEALEAALSLLGFASERAQFEVVVRLIRLVEPVLFVWGRWSQWRDVLGQGIEAARQVGDASAEALFAHQKGTLAYCEDRLEEARALLQRAEELRSRLGDRVGAELSRGHLALARAASGAPSPDPNGQSGQHRRSAKGRAFLAALLTAVGAVALVTAVKGAASDDPTVPPSVTVPPISSISTPTDPTAPTSPKDPTGPTETEPPVGGGTPSAKGSPAALSFPNTSTAGPSVPLRFTLTSTGTAALTVAEAQLGGAAPQDFEITTDDCSGERLDSGTECAIEVVFRPTVTGLREATLKIPDNSPGDVRTVRLSGTGTLPPDLIPEITSIVKDGVTFQIKNVGRGAAAFSTASVVFTPVGGRSGKPIEAPRFQLSAGANHVAPTIDVPDECAYPIECIVVVTADVRDEVTESNEANDTSGSLPPPPIE
ncbi:choice-of-anchor D domain-containing protein [Streptomyces canus]|uniref:choice-of-anchor D domain-containing protein n=1 Tax=Streptomyces canus TaxID=58343 RepID=UPI0030E30B63